MNRIRLSAGLIFGLLLNVYTPVSAQCPTGDVTLSSQAEVNSFVVDYGSCATLPGNLIIGDNTDPIVDSDIIDLSGLSSLVTVMGDLEIRSNPSLTDLDGLNNLQEVDFDLSIIDNNGLANIADLTSLNSIGSNFNIITNMALTSISGLNNITIGVGMDIDGNNNLTNISGLNNVDCGEIMVIRNNNSLSSISGLSSLTASDMVVIAGNAILTDLSGYSTSAPVAANVFKNPILEVCAVDGICTAIDAGLANFIANNLPGCNSQAEVESSCLALLPVELVHFSAKAKGINAQLKWRTASEVNNLGFMIEHSIDGNRWSELTFVNGQGSTTQNQSYNFLHKNSSSDLNYYRLKQIDFDGTYTYSSVELVRFKRNNAKGLAQVYPNPSNGQFRIVVKGESNLRTQLRLADVHGRLIWSKFLEAEENSSSFFTDLDLPSDQIYFLYVQNGTDVEVIKVQTLDLD